MTSNPQKLSGAERRKHQRAEFKEVLEVHPVLASKSGNVYEVDEQGIQGKSLDLSEGGLRVLLPVPLEAGKILKVKLPTPKKNAGDIYTKIAWVNGTVCGLQFIVLDAATRLFIHGFVEKSF